MLDDSHRVPHTDEKPRDGALESGADRELSPDGTKVKHRVQPVQGLIVAVMGFRVHTRFISNSFDHADEFQSLGLVL